MASLPLDVQNILNKQLGKVVRRDFESEAKKRFQEIKKELINEFVRHPVTVELLSGASGSNISGTLGGVSNLFSFIGFDSSYDPIEPILAIFNSIDITYGGEINMGNKFNVNMPTAEDIFAVTPMPWASGRSWAKGIERGISGLGFLLRKTSSKSRSGQAIQSGVKVRGGKFKNTPYISALIVKYSKKFSELK
jgi:hypothetical protein